MDAFLDHKIDLRRKKLPFALHRSSAFVLIRTSKCDIRLTKGTK